MIEPDDDFDRLYASFRWRVPERFNIAEAVCGRWAARRPDGLALLCVDGAGRPEPWRFGDLERAANRLAHALAAHGARAGTRIALILPQGPHTLIAHLAAYKLAAVAVPLSTLFGPEGLAYRLADCAAEIAVTHAAGAARLEAIRGELDALRLVVTTDGPAPGTVAWDALVDAARDDPVAADTGPDDPALLIYTSGTTGQPKGALHGHRVLLGHVPGLQTTHDFFPQAGDLFWTPSDWAWAGGLLNCLLPSLYFGVPVLARRFDKFDPEAALALMATHGVRNAFMPPTALKMLRAAGADRARHGVRLRTLGSAGEALGREVFDWTEGALGVPVNEFYGQTECNYVLGSCARLGVARAGAIGKPLPGHEVAVVDADGRPLPADTEGEIAIARPNPSLFLEYWGKPRATADKFVGRWMTTGDRAMRDADGYIRFVGRDDDVITSAGYRIGPAEIEDCLARHPAVALAAAVGKPDPVRTEIVKAFVVLKAGHTGDDALAGEIRDFVRTRLSAHEYPREIAFIDALPMTTSGKVIRRALKERA